MKTPGADARVQRVVEFFEGLRVEDLPRLGELYAPQAFFKDPFNEVRGTQAIEAIFAHMFRTLEQPRFIVHEAVLQGEQCFLTWDFVFRPRKSGSQPLTVRGASHLQFGADGRITRHRDYWDAAEELYEKLPVLGALMRWLKRRVNA
jgi:ketosteroid isomerase-like protein